MGVGKLCQMSRHADIFLRIGRLLTVFERVDSPGSLDSLIGTQTWLAQEERNVTIVSAIVLPQ